ncbi:B3 domain-containing protein Os04g0386900-like isoform X1 [Juglans microcarpa x Juglans regia]|uniref:B3 domain-containing protein Os04g0386900-like isoform X1 n=1 Tax=Juglans microcarpa x Juglans regia TaxID=2249226 RepID=UPI001B7F60FB|nr:B3 domain-containing protein Os04g0386900-like isoform X1 [Juglans microcarpa x Juglans regia]XP_040993435.1 B3 domain-containing protein Os04g0386900-like isoform X1 [Juglans microcarpa x Juglans regia]XP_040993436.1 B3 domain-containing protein Os04g0386900-like isoform X1 [Juglans microcarpa x Juglans regia]XP_040993437.1 B3 domain-containing protein Os04g0386900-like isoform X1 [Juglans microcarpa x Juglans regia]XP_040993438.1 B3 domain-containing protein Os04g0386900-like isoform X1 [J
MEDPPEQPETSPMTTKLQGDECLPLSGKPYCDIILAKSHVRPRYQMALPVKLNRIIPPLVIPMVLTYRGKNWEMLYKGTHTVKWLGSGWKAFVDDNDLKAGDACVFELMESCRTKIILRVHILRGNIPSEFLDKVEGGGGNADGRLGSGRVAPFD